jgi:hypothetical protein
MASSNEKKLGLHSIKSRLEKLEVSQNSVSEEDDVLSDLVKRLKNRETENKRKTMLSILEHFETDLKQSIIIDDGNLVKILIFSIKYVENNHIKLSSYLNVKTCSEFKHELCKAFVEHICKSFPNDLIDKSIHSLCNEIYPKLNDIEEILKDKPHDAKRLANPYGVDETIKKKKSFFGKTIK